MTGHSPTAQSLIKWSKLPYPYGPSSETFVDFAMLSLIDRGDFLTSTDRYRLPYTLSLIVHKTLALRDAKPVSCALEVGSTCSVKYISAYDLRRKLFMHKRDQFKDVLVSAQIFQL